MGEELQLRIHGDRSLPVLIYLPGLHGDWTLIGSLRSELVGKVCFAELTYPRTLEWSLDDYAREIENKLSQAEISKGWLLAESFSSQVAWQIAKRSMRAEGGFQCEGIILAGGFVKHPSALGVLCLKGICSLTPMWAVRVFLGLYAIYARFRHRRAQQTLSDLEEFVRRRSKLDIQAMNHRLNLMRQNDFRSIVRQLELPVYVLAGFWDPIVPRLWTQIWLRKNCPGFRGDKTLWTADHNVLGTQPKAAAETILNWIKGTS